MWKWLLHLGTIKDYAAVSFTCPADPAGGSPAIGYYDPTSVAGAFNALAITSVITVLLIVLFAYLGTYKTLGPRFVVRWYWALVVAAVVCAILPYAVLPVMPTYALAGTCPTDPTPFPLRLPESLIMHRAIAGFVWGALAYWLISVVLTLTVGRFASVKNGFFHNRGCPHPRLVP